MPALSSAVDALPWQPEDNAFIRLPADCEEAKEKEGGYNRSSNQFGAWESAEWRGGGGWGIAPIPACFIVPSLPHQSVRQV